MANPKRWQRELILETLWACRKLLHGVDLHITVKWSATDTWAETWQEDGRWCMWIDKGLSRVLFKETLVHEIGHVVAGEHVEPEGDHGPLWGSGYAAVYRAVYENKP